MMRYNAGLRVLMNVIFCRTLSPGCTRAVSSAHLQCKARAYTKPSILSTEADRRLLWEVQLALERVHLTHQTVEEA